MAIDNGNCATISVSGHQFTIRVAPSENDPAGGNGFIQELEGAKEIIGYDCVVKVFHSGRGPTRYSRFVKEADFMRNKDKDIEFQKFVVPCVDSCTPDYEKVKNGTDIAWIAMPKCETWDSSKKHPLNEILCALSQILESIAYFHKLGIAHRDIKIQNILKNSNERWVLSDYGLIFSDGDDTLTEAGNCVCSYGGPPELERRTKDGSFDIFQYSDFYLFGKLCWQMITKEKFLFPGQFDLSQRVLGPLLKAFRKMGTCCKCLYDIMEGTIKDDFTKRIGLDHIKSLLESQKVIIESDDRGLLDENGSFLYDLELWMLPSDQVKEWSDSARIEHVLGELPSRYDVRATERRLAPNYGNCHQLSFGNARLEERCLDPLTFELTYNNKSRLSFCVQKVRKENKTLVLTLNNPPSSATKFRLADYNAPNQSEMPYLSDEWELEIFY